MTEPQVALAWHDRNQTDVWVIANLRARFASELEIATLEGRIKAMREVELNERAEDRAALREAPDMTCESPEARAWRTKHATALARAEGQG